MSNEDKDLVRFVVICPPRSGSTWFCDLLRKNGIMKEVHAHFENLHFKAVLTEEDYKNKELEDIVEEAFVKSETIYAGKRIQSFKFLTSHFRGIKEKFVEFGGKTYDYDFSKIFHYLTVKKNVKVICLDRKNERAMLASWVNAMATNQWFFKNKNRQSFVSKNIILFHYLQNVYRNFIQRDHKEFKKWIRGDYLQIFYENFEKRPEKVIRDCFRYLNLPAPEKVDVQTGYRVQRRPDSMDTIKRHERFKPKFLLDLFVFLSQLIHGDKLYKARHHEHDF